MEIVAITNGGLKVRSKNTSFTVNPVGKVDTDVVIVTNNKVDHVALADKIVLDGPGEYEVAGVSIKSERVSGGIYFDLLEDNQRLLLFSKIESVKEKETENYNAVVLLPEEKVDGELSAVTSDVVVIAGGQDLLPDEKENLKKTDKLNLKKVEEYKGFLVHLTK